MTHSIPDALGGGAEHAARPRCSSPATTSSTRPRSTGSRPTSRAWPSSAPRACCCSAATRRTSTARAGRSSESGVGPRLEEVFSRCEGRIVVTCFASNIHRVQQVVDAAADARAQGRADRPLDAQEHEHRPLAGAHRRARRACSIQPARDRGLPRRARSWSSSRPGSQGEPLSALRRMAHRDHPQVELHGGDTVVFCARRRSRATSARSTRPSTGSTRSAATSSRRATRRSTRPGHGYAEEVKLMLNLARPTYVMPFHGDYKRIHLHGQLAEAVGIDPDAHLQGRERPAAGDRRAAARASASTSSPG